MEHNCATCDKKLVAKAKSCNAPPPRLRGERKSLSVNEAVRSLDLAPCRLPAGRAAPAHAARPRHRGISVADMFMDGQSVASNYTQGADSASLVSMDFSSYELMRNVSRANCNSEGAVSSSASMFGPTERSMKDEHLERYFRSVELWARRRRDGPGNLR